MSMRLLLRAVRIPPRPLDRALSTHTPRPNAYHHASPRRLSSLGLASGVLVATSLVVAHSQNAVHADSEPNATPLPSPPLRSLVRSYIVYAMCSIPALVDWSPKILSTCLSIPVVSTITEAVVRVTFFDQVRLQLRCGERQLSFFAVCRCGDGARCPTAARAVPCGEQGLSIRLQCRGGRRRCEREE